MSKPRILILRGGAIGDFIFTFPAFQALRKRWPESYIEITGYPHIAQLAQAGGLADAVTSLDKAEVARYFAFKPSIPHEQAEYIKSFDLIISYLFDPGGSVKENLLRIGAKQVIYGSPLIKSGHAVDSLMKPLEDLAIYPEGPETPRLNLKESHIKAGWETAARLGEKVVAIHPGSGSPKKNWPLEKFILLSKTISELTTFTPVFITGEADGAISKELAGMKTPAQVISGHSLVDLAGILSACKGYAGNDSGITHLAAALGIPVVAIFGPTDPAMWAPRGTNARIILTKKDNDLSNIPPEEVFTALNALMPNTRGTAINEKEDIHG